MKTWFVWGNNLPRLEIVSNSMDKALEKARQIDDKYNTCQLKDIKLMDKKVAIMTEHGTFYDYHGIPVMVTYHPSALLRQPELKRGAWNDLKAFKAKLDTLK